jgi:hypothetical protein
VVVGSGPQMTDPGFGRFGIGEHAEGHEVLEEGTENRAIGQLDAALLGAQQRGMVQAQQPGGVSTVAAAVKQLGD